MRLAFSIIYIILIFALLICTILTRRSERPVRNSVAFLEASLIPPVIGNLLIVASTERIPALIGCYFYYIGMNLIMYALVNFTDTYCRRPDSTRHHRPTSMYLALSADSIQMILNPFFGHAFEVQAVKIDGAPYYKLVPFMWQTVHRLVDYFIFFCVILIFILATVKAPKINKERYSVILVTMISVGLLQTYNILAKHNIDRSVLGYGFFGVVLFYFSIRYRPLRLLDRVLSNIVSGLSDAFYVFDPNGNCIWANDQGCTLADIKDNDYDAVKDKLINLFGSPEINDSNIAKRKVGEGENERFYVLEEKQVTDEKGRIDGTYLRIQDVTEGEHQIQVLDEQIGQISQQAFRDALTGVGSKAAYLKKVNEINQEINSGNAEFAVLMVDMNNLKQINDDHGHKAGDLYIKGCCHMICEMFKNSPVFRIGGDEFVAVLQGKDYDKRNKKVAELREMFADSFADTSVDPWLRYSAAVGVSDYTDSDSTFEVVFKRADSVMYDDKKAFKQAYGSYR